MASRTQEMRRIAVVVENEHGQTVLGARVEIFSDGLHFGELTTGGESTIEITGNIALQLRVQIAEFSVLALVGPTSSSERIVIPTSRVLGVAAIPTARCPDGTAGQPCVTCQVGGRTIRICA